MMKPANKLKRAYSPLAYSVASIRLGVSATVITPTYVKYIRVRVMNTMNQKNFPAKMPQRNQPA